MSNSQSLYQELKNELQSLAEPLFEFGCEQVEKRGTFLPVGAKLTADGSVQLVAAASDEDVTTSDVVLPLLVTALQQSAKDADAIAVCEWVKIELEPGKWKDAVKVQVHHRRGLAVAFYIPATKRFLRKWEFGEMIVTPSAGLLPSWTAD